MAAIMQRIANFILMSIVKVKAPISKILPVFKRVKRGKFRRVVGLIS